MINKKFIRTLSNRTFITAIVTTVFISGIGLHLCTRAATSSPPDAITPDGAQYHGQLVDGKLQGHGKLEWANGAQFEGEFDKGLMSGKGKYRSNSGVTYEGDYKNGLMNGEGRLVYSDGGVYTGHFTDGNFNGEGRYQVSKDQLYVGSFVNGLYDGQGKWTTDDEEYVGEFKKGKFSGKGEVKYKNGRKYSGEFVDGSYQGKGRFEYPDGLFYEGDFVHGVFEGNGVYQRKDGARYVGSFKKWRFDGAGTYTDAKGNVYQGTFIDGEMTGKGQVIGKDGRRYDGEFKDWRFEGPGTYRLANGDEYKGSFKYGVYDGQGTLVYATPQKDGRTKDSGTWNYGVFENKEALKQTKINVETALYNQRTLLDKTLAAIAPHKPGEINLYLLAIGGDGAQEVFHRETEFVRKQFDRDFGTQGRSMILVNSRNTVANAPMATVTSIHESLMAIANKMDKEHDILFLFLTSHGSRTHEFSLDQNGMDLRNLEANELGKLLKETGIRWKVVVVSACYSGGFIDPLKDDHTMVITAARHDRTSFGCADENDFTYFGKAFFKESLPNSASFSEAFGKAKALIARWETEDAKKSEKAGDKADEKDEEDSHSEPQIYHAALIDDYLKRWHAQIKSASLPSDTKPSLRADAADKK
ncbi:MAG TPA: C13 family peptidase [Burkholderiaceae bacterium]